ncbi:16S rRNA (adenine(1518)-N(6)/adenine(1519)-N(6))-dimethyltransferase RsmA [uncultured Desulfovibrio sp.]|uniref:16S rRNA (adenine(1518)-N(6)/adenine(1519)-N(6))- dimethyltransferase RsmA n=1 Tax=uncultured Desulfovibrio sp. TaxID=167968 RepID=UPI00272D9CA1|nr:16S rRNA (adenine(1518)-N(6)/adenine(1519)-N(6))-dimethyltransferase RsmA [uncultured Desulfovibrio sp.]
MPASLKNSRPAPRAKKSLGQHFLRREEICARIAALLLPRPEDRMLEIGPGPGALTRALEDGPHACLLLLEKDRHWAAERQRLAGPRTQAVLTDALRFDWRRIGPERPWKIIGNLPYNVASPLIWDIVSQSRGLSRAVFMVQKEVGQRLAAAPGNGHYGALSVWVQSHARPRLEFVVGPGAFSPPPRVDSAVLSFEPLPAEALPDRPDALSRLLRICFQQRRKQLGGIFRRAGLPQLEEALERTGLAPHLRPEALHKEDFLRLAAFLPPNLDKQGQKRLS